MTKLYEKNKLNFALAWIGGYVVSTSLADGLSDAIGVAKLITVPVLLVLTLILSRWVCRRGLAADFGLVPFRGVWAEYLWFAPLGVLLTVNLWNGVAMNFSPAETLLYITSMLLVGFLEEVIFRGLLFRAMEEWDVRKAFVISSLTFGFGHIVNLLNGAALVPTLLQIFYAAAIGFLFTLIVYKSGSLWPCILTHGIFNALSAFSAEAGSAGRAITFLALCLIPGGYSLWILKRVTPR